MSHISIYGLLQLTYKFIKTFFMLEVAINPETEINILCACMNAGVFTHDEAFTGTKTSAGMGMLTWYLTLCSTLEAGQWTGLIPPVLTGENTCVHYLHLCIQAITYIKISLILKNEGINTM